MRFKLDENLSASAGTVLVAAGHDVQTAGQEHLLGAPDSSVIAACTREARLLITLDLDFADITAYPPEQYRGILVLRLQSQNTEIIRDALRRCLPYFEQEPLDARLWIIEENRIRIRGGDERD